MNLIDWIPYSFIVVPLVLLVVCMLLPKKTAQRLGIPLAGAASLLQLVAAAIEFFLLVLYKTDEVSFGVFCDRETGGAAYFTVDLISLFLMFCVGFVCLISILNASETVRSGKRGFFGVLMALMLGMNGMLLVRDMFSLYVFLEIVGVASFVLIAMFRTEEGLEGSFKYLTMSALATIFILTGLAFLFMENGSLDYAGLYNVFVKETSSSKLLLDFIALLLLVSGFAIKAGAAPFHFWLPDAHQSANTAVSVLLSGIVIKIAGVYSLLVLSWRVFPDVAVIHTAMAVIGLFTIFVGALFALRQSHFKRVAAYSSVSQMGYILLGLSAGGTLGLVGALLHVFSHAAFKTTLFTNAAALHERLDTLEMDEMGGIEKVMPVTGFSSVCAFLSCAGIPPFTGFWSKLVIMIALWQSGMKGAAAAALCASILTAAYFLRLQKKVFFGELPEKWNNIKEIGGSLKLGEVLLMVVNLGAGLCFPLVLMFLRYAGLV